MDNISENLYNIYIKLQNDVKRFEEKINDKDSHSVLLNGLNNKRIRIGLFGHYSTGKTTLLKRFFGSYAGAISSAPETACLTVHRLDNFQGITIKFKSSFIITNDNEENFLKFLDDNKLSKYVKQKNANTWESCQDEEVSPDYKIMDIKKFLENVNKYMNAIEKIYWCHKKSKTDNFNILDFLEIYDLPGFGGTDDHENVIKNIITNESFDIIIYLIDPSQGIPKDSDINKLIELSDSIEQGNQNVLFYWGYEKPIENLDIEQALNDINQVIENKLVNSFYKKAQLLDLTGDIDDTEVPQNVLTQNVASIYFQYAGTKFLKSQDDFWEKEKKKLPIFDLQSILNKIDDLSRKTPVVTEDQIKKIFKEGLNLDFEITKQDFFDSQEFKAVKDKIEPYLKKGYDFLKNLIYKNKPYYESINEDNIPKSFELNEEEEKNLAILTLKNQILKTCLNMIAFISKGLITKTADINKVRWPFHEEYKKNVDWQLLKTRINDYNNKKNYSSIRQNHLADIGTDIYRDIKKDINTINDILCGEKIYIPPKQDYQSTDDINACFNVTSNDSAQNAISSNDLEIIRTPDYNYNLQNDIIEYVRDIAIKIKKDIKSVEDNVDKSNENMKEEIKKFEDNDNFLKELGM